MKLRFMAGAFIFIALIALPTITLNSVFAPEECSQIKMAEMTSEYMFVRDFTFGGVLVSAENLGAFLQKETYKFIERKGAGAHIILLRSLEVDKIYKNFVIRVRAIEFPLKSEQEKPKLCISKHVKYLGENYEEEERNYRIRGRCLEYFLHDMEEDIIIKIYLNCGWGI